MQLYSEPKEKDPSLLVLELNFRIPQLGVVHGPPPTRLACQLNPIVIQ